MIFVVSQTGVPFDVMYNVAIEKGMEKPVMCLASGNWQVAMDAVDYDFDMAIDIALTIDGMSEEGIQADTDDTGAYGDDNTAFDVIKVPVQEHTYYYVVTHGE